jgi:LmbE family N-acetylglucosaminyl deacetylase
VDDDAADAGASAEEYLRDYDRLVVVAPHPDDDVLGCGGTLAAAAAIGLDITVVYVTDGSASHVGSAAYPPQRLRDLREHEARAALAVLGVATAPRFLRIPDGTVADLPAGEAAAVVTALGEAIGQGKRPLVLGPWIRDHHADHLAVAALVRRACELHPAATLLEYAVWLDERGSESDRPEQQEGGRLVLDVRRYVGSKSAALAEHRSQLGTLVTDAAQAFALPPGLIALTARPNERFVVRSGPRH